MNYQLPICYNLVHIDYEKKKFPQVESNSLITLPTAIEVAKQKQETITNNVLTVYISDYIASTTNSASSESIEQIDFEAIISKLKRNNSSTSEGECLYFQFLFPVNKFNNNIINEELLITSSMNNSLNNRDSLYEVGCKVFSISKIIK